MVHERHPSRSPDTDSNAPLTAASTLVPQHDLVVVYHSSKKKWGFQQYSQDEHESLTANGSASEEGLGQIVFLRGFLSPSWVSAIGSTYRIDPEFFRRHMDFLSKTVHRKPFSSPSLPSTSSNMFRLCVSTILHRDHPRDQDIQHQRRDSSLRFGSYKSQQLGSAKLSCGDSLVRDYSTLCSSFSVLEQWISICITKQDKGWASTWFALRIHSRIAANPL